MSSPAQQIKERLSITDVVGSYVKLENAGGNLKARCPFHNEKTASFFVSPARQTYHCFGCSAGGDIFTFVEEIEGLDFRGALSVLAERAGVVLGHPDPKEQSEQSRMFDALAEATSFFEATLAGQKDALAYLSGRGVDADMIKKWRIGYAPAQWSALSSALARKKFSDDMLIRAGLAIAGERGVYDRFRGRIMFPIADQSGRIVAFSGRIFPESPDNKAGKYINSPETELYSKSKILFGFDKAKEAIRKEGACVLVEGQMDLVMSHKAGVEHAVAVSGTALSAHHLGMVGRLSKNLIFAFDADDAGISASRRALALALSLGMGVRVASISAGKDPADIALKDPTAWQHSVRNAVHVIDFYLSVWHGKGYDKNELGIKIEEVALPLIARMKNVREQSEFITKVARVLDIKEERVWDILRSLPESGESPPRAPEEGRRPPLRPPKTRRQVVERRVASMLFWQEKEHAPVIPIETYKSAYREIVGEKDFNRAYGVPEKIKEDLIFEAEFHYQSVKDIKSELEGVLRYLEQEVQKEEFARTMSELHEAERVGNTEEATRLLAECKRISEKINSLK